MLLTTSVTLKHKCHVDNKPWDVQEAALLTTKPSGIFPRNPPDDISVDMWHLWGKPFGKAKKPIVHVPGIALSDCGLWVSERHDDVMTLNRSPITGPLVGERQTPKKCFI